MAQDTLDGRPEVVAYIRRVIVALRDMDGIAKASAVRDAIVASMNAQGLPINETQLNSGVAKYQNDIQWARMYLVNAGMLEPYDAKSHGIWKLTRKGWQTSTDADAILAIYRPGPDPQQAPPSDEGKQSDMIEMQTWESQVKAMLQSMPHKGFERLCAEIMAKNGLHATKVTGQSNDKGIDGEGLMAFDQLELVSIRVAWQCKRFKDGKVGSVDVRNFRGSLDQSTHHGVVFTTTAFTTEALGEARQPGKTPIKLVDVKGLIESLKKLNLGMLDGPKREVDQAFFEPFLNPAGQAEGLPLLTAAAS